MVDRNTKQLIRSTPTPNNKPALLNPALQKYVSQLDSSKAVGISDWLKKKVGHYWLFLHCLQSSTVKDTDVTTVH